MTANLIAGAAFVVSAFVFLSPRLRASDAWRATVTPLASIIGSGFLVSLPLLASFVGTYAIIAMGFLIATAYLLGGAIRFNILHGEPLFEADEGRHGVAVLERLSHLALAFAYFVSVTYYLSLLSAFALKGVGVDPGWARVLTTALLAVIGGYGLWRGLHGLETLEEYAVGLKLAVIAAVLAALVWLNVRLLADGTWHIKAAEPHLSWDTARLVLGLLIVVQGFETSRFLEGAYPPQLRVRTMRWAQVMSGAIYLAFFALATVIFDGSYARDDVAAVTDMMVIAAAVLPLMLTAGAIFAQFSAAVADAIGAGGLMEYTPPLKIERGRAYVLVAAVGILLTWTINVFGIIALASRAFALFYMMQCLVAALVARAAPDVTHRGWRVAGFVILGALALAVVVLGIPAEVE